jgi:aspartyl-tRNA(Asn)/glutamyl-tRNA(Gln) amidotransferase subunit C
MSISEEEVRHVALLARLGLKDDEVLRLRDELSGILEQVDKIGELDLEDVEPMAHAVDVINVTRPDENRPCLTQEEALLNAPESRDGAFVIPRIV